MPEPMQQPGPAPGGTAPSWRDVFDDAAATGDEAALLATCSPAEAARMAADWAVWGRADQRPPEMVSGRSDWRVWLLLGGRGAGKTRAGAEWVRGLATGDGRFGPCARRIALVGETFADVREVMVEGVSGLLAVHPRGQRPRFEPSRRRLVWPGGAVAQLFSADDPESLRGPQFDAAWVDELGKWRRAQAAWDMLQFGMRLGQRPRVTVTTTPRPLPLLKRIAADPGTAVSRAATRLNRYNLATSFLRTVMERYGGTRLGRQELDGEFVEERADALWTRDGLEACRAAEAPARLERIVVAVDPPASSSRRADACGIVAAGIDAGGTVWVLEDASLSAVRPAAWAARAAALAHRLEADAVVVEVNQGGEMAEAVLREHDPALVVRPVRATRGKHLRAEPVAHLYEQGRVRHAGAFPELEDELCDFGPTEHGYGLSGGRSPDRLDALVWAVTALALTPRPARPRVRRL